MRALLLLSLLWALPLSAAPKVVATIPPLAGMVADIMEGVGTPTTLLAPNAEPHSFSLRPSQLAALREADIVFAVGLNMEPWLGRIESSLEGNLAIIKLGEAVSEAVPARGFDLSPRPEDDPHLWLDPGETIGWVLEISQQLINIDSTNTAIYRANEFALLTEVVAAKEALADIGGRLKAAEIRLVVSHDAYQYLERRLGVSALGMLSDSTDTAAGARSLSKISRLEGPLCLIETPEHRISTDFLPESPRVVIDPMGAEFAGAPRFVSQYYAGIATALEGCFNQP